MNKSFEKLFQLTCTILSLAALAAINYSIIHNTFIFVIILVLLAHELGHYFAAKNAGTEPSLPIFIPLPFLLIAATKIKNSDKNKIKQISLAGPVAGALATLMLMIFTKIFNVAILPIKYLIMLFFKEIFFNFFGSDGKKYRNA